jgi:hypothetical protein
MHDEIMAYVGSPGKKLFLTGTTNAANNNIDNVLFTFVESVYTSWEYKVVIKVTIDASDVAKVNAYVNTTGIQNITVWHQP